MTPRILVGVAAFAVLCLPAAAHAADIVISPPASGGVAITNAAGNATRLRVADDGTVTLPGLAALPVAGTGLCLEIATGQVGTCPAGGSGGTVTSLIAGTGLTGGTITTSGTIGIASGGVGTAQLADGSVTLAKIAANGCANGQVLQFGKEVWTCGSVSGSSGTVTNIATGTGLTGGPITASGTIGIANAGVRDVVGKNIAGVHDAGNLVGQAVDLVHHPPDALQVVAVAEVRVGDLDKIESNPGCSVRRDSLGTGRQHRDQPEQHAEQRSFKRAFHH